VRAAGVNLATEPGDTLDPMASSTDSLAYYTAVTGLVPLLFVAMAVDRRTAEDALAMPDHYTAQARYDAKASKLYELFAVAYLVIAEVVALHVLYVGRGSNAAAAATAMLLAFSGFIIAAPRLARTIRAVFMTNAFWDVFITLGVLPVATLCGLVAGISTYDGSKQPWWLIIVPAAPTAIVVAAMLVGDQVRWRARADGTA
jgi:hypothetical protein